MTAKHIRLTAESFEALAALLRSQGGAAEKAARRVLVEGLAQKDAADEAGITPQAVSGVISSYRDALSKCEIAVSGAASVNNSGNESHPGNLSLQQLMAKAANDWATSSLRDVVQPYRDMLTVLAGAGRFDDFTKVLNWWLAEYKNMPIMIQTMMHSVPQLIVESYIAKQEGVGHKQLRESWEQGDIIEELRSAAVQRKKLGVVVSNITIRFKTD